MGKRKAKLVIPHSQLVYGGNTGVSLKEAKHSFLSGMSKPFRRKVRIHFKR